MVIVVCDSRRRSSGINSASALMPMIPMGRSATGSTMFHRAILRAPDTSPSRRMRASRVCSRLGRSETWPSTSVPFNAWCTALPSAMRSRLSMLPAVPVPPGDGSHPNNRRSRPCAAAQSTITSGTAADRAAPRLAGAVLPSSRCGRRRWRDGSRARNAPRARSPLRCTKHAAACGHGLAQTLEGPKHRRRSHETTLREN